MKTLSTKGPSTPLEKWQTNVILKFKCKLRRKKHVINIDLKVKIIIKIKDGCHLKTLTPVNFI
jgi:hypothetical protein